MTNQYGKDYLTDVNKEPVEITITDTKEAPSKHKPNSILVGSNGTSERDENDYSKLSISKAEIGDTYKLTATVAGTNISSTVNITVGADNSAKLSSKEANNHDADFRKTYLGYDR